MRVTLVLMAGFTGLAQAAVTISSAATSNMSCASGVCQPLAAHAVLNAGDLESMLASGNVEVTTTGSGVQANDVVIKAPVGWQSTSTLDLDAYHSITISKPISVDGAGGMSLTTNDGGSGGFLLFLEKGSFAFANLTSNLSINGKAYTLFNTLPSLADAIAANPSGAYALAANYDARQDGTYASSPIDTVFTGSFNGLGNTIANLSISDEIVGDYVGLFTEIGPAGSVASINLTNLKLEGSQISAGGLVSINEGSIGNASTSGSITINPNNSDFAAGGLANLNYGGTITLSQATVRISVSGANSGAGLVAGTAGGAITQCFANGNISIGLNGLAGGFAAESDGAISDSYATGKLTSGAEATLGGFIGENDSTVAQAYSIGNVKGPQRKVQGYKGGFVGYDEALAGSISGTYWDTTTGIDNPNRGAGNISKDPGITGQTTQQLQAGLPPGFDPAIWAEDPKINNGFPYLINNPPR